MSLSPLDLLKMSARSLWSNPTRSLLTTLGTFIGVAAVNATLQVGNISQAIIQRQLDSQEAPQIHAGVRGRTPLMEADTNWLRSRLSGVRAMGRKTFFESGQVNVGDRETYIWCSAVSLNYLQTSGRQVTRGRFFDRDDFRQFRSVAIIDESLAAALFSEENPIDKTLFLKNVPYRIIGTIEAKPITSEGEVWHTMLVPLSLHAARRGIEEARSLHLRPQKLSAIDRQETEVTQLLQQRFAPKEAWSWSNVEDILRQQDAMKITERGLFAVGAIALFISGVGIANITIASTLERTSEIGLKRAIGATPRDILRQFVIEGVLVSLAGGIFAIAVVDVGTRWVARQFALPYRFEITTAGLTLGMAIAVGVGASYFPARHASRLNPIAALRDR
ncbi:MAG: ABC transporter permease [Cyanobacteria bacterium SBLK]|nr:ABC transporter permease [Cyanobacteria bacterium SBLK]